MTINTFLPTATAPIQINQNTLSDQSPPKTVALNDGRVLHIWTDFGASDDTTLMQLQGRIYNADGSASTSQFALGSWAVDGFDGFDEDNLDVDVLTNGNVVIGYVRNTVAVGGDYDEPVATIINPSTAPGANGFVVAQNIVIQQNDTTIYESPPTITALADGRFIAVWSKNGAWDDTTEQPILARIFNANGTPSTNEFKVGNWNVDGSDGYDMSNITVTQLTGGNIVVGFERSYKENGGDEPVFTVLNSNGVAVKVDVEFQQNDTTTWESPPVMSALADGRFMAVWVKNGLDDNGSGMKIDGRIFNADGTPSTNEFQVGSIPADGFDAYDTSNVVIEQLSNGNVVVGFVSNTVYDGKDYPYFNIINPSVTPGSAGFAVASDVQINNESSTVYYAGPPVIQDLANGNFVAAWVDGNVGDNGLPIKARIFDSNGNALSDEILVVNRGNSGISTFDGFDWDNLNVVVQADGKFVISWVGINDGSGTSVMTSGPIDPTNYGVGTPIFTSATLAPASDTGVKGDNVTADNSPSFIITNPTNLPVKLYAYGQEVPSTYDPVTKTVTLTGNAPDGTYPITYALVSNGVTGSQSAPLNVTIDTTAPSTPSDTADMTAATDSGVSNADNNTKDSTPDFAVTAPAGTTPSLYVDGVKVPATYANSALTPVNPIADGNHNVTYTLTDAAGNESAQSPALPVVIGSDGTIVNVAPDAVNDSVSGFTNTPVVISPATLLGNDSDANGDPLIGVSIQDAQHGTVAFDGTNVIFTPEAGYTGAASFSYTITDGKGGFDTATVSLNIAPNQHTGGATEGDDVLNGTNGNDTINGLGGNDIINGGAGDDTLNGDNGDDTISGGAGSDTLNGGAGNDTFVWKLADVSAPGQETDTIQNANLGDKIDLKDLLQGEHFDAASLDNYLHFSTENGNTVMTVSALGSFGDGNQSGPNLMCSQAGDQKIVIEGFDLTGGNTMSDMQVIQQLINANALITD